MLLCVDSNTDLAQARTTMVGHTLLSYINLDYFKTLLSKTPTKNPKILGFFLELK